MAKSLPEMIGQANNLDEPTPLANESGTVLGVTITLLVLAWLMGGLRIWTRFKIIKAPGWDDFALACALVSITAGTVAVCLGVTHYGLGQHFVLLGGIEAWSNFFKIFYVANGTYVGSTTFIKLALLLQYLRVFDRGTALYRASFILAVVIGLWGLAYSILVWFPCSPVDSYWAIQPGANCWAYGSQNPNILLATFESHTALNMVFDILVLGLPVPLYFMSDVQKKTKWGLLCLLALGAIVTSMSIWRLASIISTRAATSPTFDPSWYGCQAILLASVEVYLAVICASVPVFWPVLKEAGFQIFITREVQVTREERLHSRGASFDNEEGLELKHSAMPPAGVGHSRMESTDTADDQKHAPHFKSSFDDDDSSDRTLRNVSSSDSMGKGQKVYKDDFEMGLPPSRHASNDDDSQPRVLPGNEATVTTAAPKQQGGGRIVPHLLRRD